jgi:hypothetical protein
MESVFRIFQACNLKYTQAVTNKIAKQKRTKERRVGQLDRTAANESINFKCAMIVAH